MMNRIKTYAPRQDKNGWRLQKFHDLLHIVRDIENYGSPNNVDAAPNENNLIDLAKRPSRRAHKKKEVFVSQVSKQLRESDLIQKPYAALSRTIDNNICMETDEDEMEMEKNMTDDDYDEDNFEDMESKLVGRPLFIVNLDPQPNQEVVECLANKKARS